MRSDSSTDIATAQMTVQRLKQAVLEPEVLTREPMESKRPSRHSTLVRKLMMSASVKFIR